MDDETHVEILKQGIECWNRWRRENPSIVPNLAKARLPYLSASCANFSHANLTKAVLSEADLRGANLRGSNLRRATLIKAVLAHASLADADLTEARLRWADFSGADLAGAQLRGADLGHATMRGADLVRSNLGGANLSHTILAAADLRRATLEDALIEHTDFGQSRLWKTAFVGVDLGKALNLETCRHYGPSILDHQTLMRSEPLPKEFLRGCGLPDRFVEYFPSLIDDAIHFYTCFISYSSRDEEFARRLYTDLQASRVPCWYAPEDMKIGDKILDSIDRAIRLRDKVLLVLSRNSVRSSWVEDEVTKAFAEERARSRAVLFPIRLDDAIMRTRRAWGAKIRDSRHIGDFRRWNDAEAYQESFARLLGDLSSRRSERT